MPADAAACDTTSYEMFDVASALTPRGCSGCPEPIEGQQTSRPAKAKAGRDVVVEDTGAVFTLS